VLYNRIGEAVPVASVCCDSTNADAAMWQDKGATVFLLGSDHGFLKEGSQALRGAVWGNDRFS
jgi:2-keto-3-deoxy-L-rhamnonate aldolase RhmA